jgi:hypothetical protein
MPDSPISVLSGATTTGAGSTMTCGVNGRHGTFAAKLTGTGSISATVILQGSHDGTAWFNVDTFTLSGTTSVVEGCYERLSCPYFRGNVTAISGTDASVDLTFAP